MKITRCRYFCCEHESNQNSNMFHDTHFGCQNSFICCFNGVKFLNVTFGWKRFTLFQWRNNTPISHPILTASERVLLNETVLWMIQVVRKIYMSGENQVEDCWNVILIEIAPEDWYSVSILIFLVLLTIIHNLGNWIKTANVRASKFCKLILF